MKYNVGRGVIERIATLTAIPYESGVRTYSSQYYPAPSLEAIERARKNRKGRGRPTLDTTKLGVQLLRQKKTREQILPIVCQLDPGYLAILSELRLGYSEELDKKQSEIEDRLWKTILEAYSR